MKQLFVAIVLLAATLVSCSEESSEATPERPIDGEQLFLMRCTLCHGEDGMLGLSGAKDLTVSAMSREEKIVIVKNGKGNMIPYKDLMTPEEIEAVVDYVESLAK